MSTSPADAECNVRFGYEAESVLGNFQPISRLVQAMSGRLYVLIRTGHADIERDFTAKVDNVVPGGCLEWSGARFWSALAVAGVDAAFASMYEVIEQQPLSDFYLLEPAFDPLRNDPRFTKALGMMNLPMPESIPALTPN